MFIFKGSENLIIQQKGFVSLNFYAWEVFEIAVKRFDKEYSTQWNTEVLYLTSRGIRYAFVKENENGITVYKYKKTKKLFDALSSLYGNLGITE